jgi:hypothetical protein
VKGPRDLTGPGVRRELVAAVQVRATLRGAAAVGVTTIAISPLRALPTGSTCVEPRYFGTKGSSALRIFS